MLTEPLPTQIFVRTRFQEKAVIQIIEKWRVERAEIENLLIQHFHDMGIFSVEPQIEKLCFQKMLFFLEHSPTIYQVVRKADEAERKRKMSRARDN